MIHTLTAYDNVQNLFAYFFLLKWHFITAAIGRHRNGKVSWAEISGTKIFLLFQITFSGRNRCFLSVLFSSLSLPSTFQYFSPHFIWTIHNSQTKSIQTLSILFIWNLLERLNKKKVNQRRDSSGWVKKTEDEVVVKTWWTRLLTPSYLNHTFFTFSFCVPSSCFFSLPFTRFHKAVLNRNQIYVMRCNKCSNCSSFLGERGREESERCDHSYCTSWIQHLEGKKELRETGRDVVTGLSLEANYCDHQPLAAFSFLLILSLFILLTFNSFHSYQFSDQ